MVRSGKRASILRLSMILALLAMFVIPATALAEEAAGVGCTVTASTAADDGNLSAMVIAAITVKGRTGANVAVQGENVIIFGEGFVPGEYVNVFFTFPDGAACNLATPMADASGEFQVVASTRGFPVGVIRVTALGRSSGLRAVTSFTVRAGVAPGVAGLATLEADILTPSLTAPTTEGSTGLQNRALLLNARNFFPGEFVNCWITEPNGSAFSVGNFQVGPDSEFAAVIPLLSTFTPTGTLSVTCFGNDSKRNAVARITITAGNNLIPTGNTATLACTPSTIRHSNFVDLRNPNLTVAECHAGGFQQGERVSFFITRPDGTVEDLGQLTAGASGVDILINQLSCTMLGRYALTAVGNATGFAAVTYFNVTD